MKKLLAIDGNSILNRAYYGIRPLTTKDGLFTNAVYGLVNTVTSNMGDVNPDFCAVAFDLKAPTFRHLKYDGYKATRKGMPEELAMQLPYAKEVLSAMGLHVLECQGYEADDILGTLARICDESEDVEGYILTGDRDSLQLISDRVKVLLVKNSGIEVYDRERFISEYGTTPDRLVDIKALMGDSSDNIPGVPGIGEKTALKLIADFGSLDGIYSQSDIQGVTRSVKEKLISGKDSAYMSYELAKIYKEVPCVQCVEPLLCTGFDRGKLYDLFTTLEFGAFIKKFDLVSEKPKADTPAFKSVTEKDIENISGGTFSAVLSESGEIYLYSENGAYVCTFDKSSPFYANNSFICDDSKHLFSLCPDINVIFDVFLADYVLNASEGNHSVQSLALTHLGISSGTSPQERAYCIYKLYKILDNLLEEQHVSELYYDIELPLAGVLAKMEKSGFRVDTDGLESFGIVLSQELDALTERIYLLAGHEFNINSPKQLGAVLFEELMLPTQKKTKTGYSTNVDVLEKLSPYHPIIDEILEYRSLSKLKSTYADGLLKVTDENGIIHTSFNQTVTATGRLSSTEPNLQNIPIRTERGRELRRFFIPKSSDYVLVDADYSQIELRILAAIAEDEKMIKAFRDNEDIHTLTASGVFGVDVNDVTPELRRRAKAVNFGIIYGIGDFSLAQDIGVTKAAAKKYIEGYLANYPGVAAYLNEIKRTAHEFGYVTTLFGRRRYIPELSSSKKTLVSFGERVAMNSPIQGTAADIIKLAMVNTQKALEKGGYDAHLILQVHDELIIETHVSCKDEVMELLKREMENVIKLPVSLTAEIKSADNWFDCK